MRGVRSDKGTGMIWVTGDKHGDFTEVDDFCRRERTRREDTLIVLGDAGINYFPDARATALKQHLAQLPITLFCVHGNHEARPETLRAYRTRPAFGGEAYADPRYPNQLFPVDGALYDIGGLRTLVVGGAYSVDKFDRLLNHWAWFEDEQPSPAIRARAEVALRAAGWRVDAVLSHTCPESVMPPGRREAWEARFGVVDTATEAWLESLRARLAFRRWFAGHFHVDLQAGAFTFLYHQFLPFGV